jgi:hypothetical protein
MRQIVGQVVTRDGKRGIPELLVTATALKAAVTIRIGTVLTDEDGRFDFGPLLSPPREELNSVDSISLRVETPLNEQTPGSDPDPDAGPLVVTQPRANPVSVETFLILVPEEKLTKAKQGHFVPTGLPRGLSEPTALVKRAALVAKQRDEIATALREAAKTGIDAARTELRRTENAIRDALVAPRPTPGPGPDGVDGLAASSPRLLRDGQSVRAAMLANVRRSLQPDPTGSRQFAKLALTDAELDALRVGREDLDTAKVEALLFGPEPDREELVRTRVDILRADCERRMRIAPPWETGRQYHVGNRVMYLGTEYECRQQHVSQSDWTPDLTPALWLRTSQLVRLPSGAALAPAAADLIDLNQAVRTMIDAAARGIVIPGERDTPGTIAEKVSKLALGGGAADEPAFFDFNVLGVSFDNVWKRQVDEHLVETATELHDELTRAGGTPTIQRRGRLFDSLREEAQVVIKAGIHIAESAAVTGAADVPDFDLLSDERRIRTRDHSVVDHRGRRSVERGRVVAHRGESGGRTRVVDIRDRDRREATPRRPQVVDHREAPPPPLPARLRQLVEELDARMGEPYCFEVFAADEDERSINFGVMFTYRQKWDPQVYQAGPLVRTLTLAPKEEKAFTIRHTTKKMTTTTQSRLDEAQNRVETTDTTRDVNDIVNAAKNSLGFQTEGSGSITYQIGSATQSWGITRNVERSNQETRQAFREAVRKASQDHKTQRKLEVSTTESVETSREETGKLVNPNDELPVTYLFFELQRRYRVSENLHRLTPVILVAQEVPGPHEITRAWLLQHDWILHQALLDESFRQALNYLCQEAAGAEIRLVELKAHLESQRKIVEEIKDQILSLQNDVSQRYYALEQSMKQRIAVVREQDSEGWLEKGGELFFGENTSLEGAKAREEAAQEAWERAVRAEREARDRLLGAVTAVEAANRDYTEARASFENSELGVLRLRVHVKQNILHYMQAIWDHEQRDQRVFRLYDTEVPRLAGQIAYKLVENPGAPPVPPLWKQTFKVEATLTILGIEQMTTLGEIADLDRPLGYRGNYMIFPLKQHNALTKFLSVPYADTRSVLHDPNEVANFTLSELDHYVECLRETMPEDDFEAIKPRIDSLYDFILSHPFPNEEDIIVPSGSLFIEALPGSAPVLEEFKLLHRAVDVTKAAAEVRSRELENLRYAARILGTQLGDPEIQTVVVAPPGTDITVPTNGSALLPSGGTGES